MRNTADIQEAKLAIDLAAIVEAEGCKLRLAGSGRLQGLCPIHPEKTPSFFVFTDRDRWHCFGCGEGGDAIDFIRKARGCSFPEALSILGVNDPKRTAAELSQIRAERRRRETMRWRERETARSLGIAIRVCHSILRRITPENFDSPTFTLLLHQLPILEYQHDLLIHDEAEDKASLVAELQGLHLLPRRLLFRRDFDFSAWLRSVRNNRGAEDDRRSRGTRGDSTRAGAEKTHHSSKNPGGEPVPARQTIRYQG